MNFRLLLYPASMLMLAACGTTGPGELPKPLEARFRAADVNRDGKVSRDEFTNFMIADAFARYDRNGGGFVTLKEYVAGGGTPETFQKIDRTGSGKFSVADAQACKVVRDFMAKPFDEADGDGSGFVTLQEFLLARERARSYVR